MHPPRVARLDSLRKEDKRGPSRVLEEYPTNYRCATSFDRFLAFSASASILFLDDPVSHIYRGTALYVVSESKQLAASLEPWLSVATSRGGLRRPLHAGIPCQAEASDALQYAPSTSSPVSALQDQALTASASVNLRTWRRIAAVSRPRTRTASRGSARTLTATGSRWTLNTSSKYSSGTGPLNEPVPVRRFPIWAVSTSSPSP